MTSRPRGLHFSLILGALALLPGVNECETGGDPTVDPSCPEASNFLDVSQGPGPGAGYPDPMLAVSCTPDELIVESNAIPHYTFVALTPNPLQERDFVWTVPRFPMVSTAPSEIPLLGIVAFSVSGLPIFGPNEAQQPTQQAYGDPVYNGIVDGCYGHTAMEYHNHALAEKCLIESGLVAEPWTNPDPDASEPSPIIGYALDGFPIYGPRGCIDEACSEVVTFNSGYVQVGDPTSYAWDAYEHREDGLETTLDQCNGRYGADGTYRYHATAGFPYILGCYRGVL